MALQNCCVFHVHIFRNLCKDHYLFCVFKQLCFGCNFGYYVHICRNLCWDVLAQAGLELGQAMKRTTMCIRAEIPQPNIALNIEIYSWSCSACWFSRFKNGRNLFFFFCPFLHLLNIKLNSFSFLYFPFCVQRGGQGGGRQHGGGGRHVTIQTPLLGGNLMELFNQSQTHLRDFFCVCPFLLSSSFSSSNKKKQFFLKINMMVMYFPYLQLQVQGVVKGQSEAPPTTI